MCAQSQPLEIWSVLKLVNYFNVCHFVHALDLVEDIAHRTADVIIKTSKSARDVPLPPTLVDDARPKLQFLRDPCSDCELKNSVKRIDQEILFGLDHGITFDNFFHQLAELKRDIRNDLEFRRFVFIPTDKAVAVDELENHWRDIWKVIPESEKDTRDAASCYALNLHSAAVFHSMRVAESGLRYLARKMKVTVSDKGKKIPVEYATWEKIITNCNNKIAEARKLPTNAKRDALLQYYSRVADHCGYMKDIWRNEVSHARKSYIEAEAKAAIDRIHAFMEFTAKGIGDRLA
jgi:hypothetical protein